MDALKLCDAVNWQIQLCGMNSQDAKVIQTCISRYTCRDGLQGKINYMINRLCNAVKAVFGESDWQQAERVVAKHVYSYVPFFCRDFVRDKTQGQVHYLAGRALNFLVWQNKEEVEVSKYAKVLVEGQLKVAKLVVSRVALNVFGQVNVYGLSLMGSYSSSQLGKLAKRVFKMDWEQQQQLALTLISKLATRLFFKTSASPVAQAA